MPSEFDLIDRHFVRPTPQAILGPGDDCALLAPSPGMELVATTDMLVAGTHFFPDTDPFQLGWKTLAVNVSDLAAMGAKPRWALLAGSLPTANESWLGEFTNGFFACADQYGVDLVGGDTTRGPLNLCVTALGEVPAGQALRRDGAHPGDDIWISGRPGLAALGLAVLQERTSLPDETRALCIEALQKPMPRVALGTALREKKLAHSAVDVSDGLLADLEHIVERSGVSAEVLASQFPDLPPGADPLLARQCQICGGDDYELIFTAAIDKRAALSRLSVELDLPLWRIGHMLVSTERNEVRLLGENGQPLPTERKGFDHFG